MSRMNVTPIERGVPAASGKRSTRMISILDLLADQGTVALADLSGILAISPATARRDLATLADQRLITRTHGGARLIDSRSELPVSLRENRFKEEKRDIDEAVGQMI